MKVFPDPVYPYAKMVELNPVSTSFMFSRERIKQTKITYLYKIQKLSFEMCIDRKLDQIVIQSCVDHLRSLYFVN